MNQKREKKPKKIFNIDLSNAVFYDIMNIANKVLTISILETVHKKCKVVLYVKQGVGYVRKNNYRKGKRKPIQQV